jgi:hypothetical protein
MDAGALGLLQDFLQARGLDTESGAEALARLDPADAEWQELQAELGWTPEAAREQLARWGAAAQWELRWRGRRSGGRQRK